ncbi:MAG: DUF58 domain-containing protein [Proteobacteria bacterium]|nr:DUF58 domain-containing protein [Pseudomonadota bacterium]
MLPSEIVQQVKRIQFHTGKQVADVLAGAYLSVFKGRGMEFEEVRPYVPGDDVRTIDWNVTARMGEPYVKRYVEERELTVLLLVDISASQNFGSAARSKREAAVELSALLAFSAISNDDKVGLLLFHGAADEYIPPRKGQKHALLVIREVLARGRDETDDSADRRAGRAGFNPVDLPRWMWRRFRRLKEVTRAESERQSKSSTSIAHALEFCRRVLPRRAVLFLISDFIDEGYLDILRSAGRRHDIVAVLVTDEREMQFDRAGLIALEDAESGRTRLVDTKSRGFRDEVKRMAEQRIDTLQSDLRASGIDLIRIDATRSVVEPLVAFFRMRKKRLRR